MRQWKYTSYKEGKKTTHWGLSPFQAVTAIERAMVGSDPFPAEGPRQQAPVQRASVDTKRSEPVTTEQLIAA